MKSSQLLKALRQNKADVTISSIALGFLRFTQYIFSRQSWLEELRSSAEIDEQDGYLLVRRVRNIQRWRLSSKASAINRSRFEQIGQRLNTAMVQELHQPFLGEGETLFPVELSDLINQWEGGEARTGDP